MTKYGYWQPQPYRSRYEVYASHAALISSRHADGARSIGSVWRAGTGWKASLHTDPLIEGCGRTRDAAVDDAYTQVGGPG